MSQRRGIAVRLHDVTSSACAYIDISYINNSGNYQHKCGTRQSWPRVNKLVDYSGFL